MQIVPFEREHIGAARQLALENYLEERQAVAELPKITETPKLNYYAENHLGMAAIENGRLIGFLGCWKPWEGAFDSEKGLGTFSPIHAHGAVRENRGRIYQDLYAAAAENWMREGITGHGIALYAHDTDAQEALFDYGFGKRCSDLIRPTHSHGEILNKDLIFEKLPLEHFPEVRDMRAGLNLHLKQSPCFLQNTDQEFSEWIARVEKGDRRTFVARLNGTAIAYIDIAGEGENFITESSGMMNVQGAWCQPEFRGRGIMRDLLTFTEIVLKQEGNSLLGVDHETYNPTAARFWRKYFTPYTYSLVRKLEDWAMIRN